MARGYCCDWQCLSAADGEDIAVRKSVYLMLYPLRAVTLPSVRPSGKGPYLGQPAILVHTHDVPVHVHGARVTTLRRAVGQGVRQRRDDVT